MSKNIREVSPILQRIREVLLGRPHTLALRFQDDIATRSPPLANLPEGPHHKLSSNYYYTRDARREVSPPELITAGQNLIGSGEQAVAAKPVKSRAPGNVFHWD